MLIISFLPEKTIPASMTFNFSGFMLGHCFTMKFQNYFIFRMSMACWQAHPCRSIIVFVVVPTLFNTFLSDITFLYFWAVFFTNWQHFFINIFSLIWQGYRNRYNLIDCGRKKNQLLFAWKKGTIVQVNLCQKLFFLQNMGRTCCVQKLYWMSETISVHNMFSPGLSLEFSCI